MNPLDRAESVITEINLQLQIETEAAIKLLRNIVYRSSRDAMVSEAIALYFQEERFQKYLEQQLEPAQEKIMELRCSWGTEVLEEI